MARAPAPQSVDDYLAGLPEDRREALQAIRAVILANLDPGFEEGIQYGMVGYYVPHSRFPAGYHCDPRQPLPFASIASQKSHIGLYLFCIYLDEAVQKRFVTAWKASGKRLDMGKACVRVKKLDDVPLEVLGELFAGITADDFVRTYEAQRAGAAAPKKRAAAKKKAAKKKVVKKKAVKKTTAKKGAKKPAAKKR